MEKTISEVLDIPKPNKNKSLLPLNTHNEIVKILDNIEIIFNYLAESVTLNSKEIIDTLIELKYKYKHKNWFEKDEKEFWKIISKINEKIFPTTVNSIIFCSRGSTENEKGKPSYPKKVVLKYTISSLIAFAFLLFIQIYVIKGGGLIEESNSLQEQYNELENELTEMRNLGLSLQNDILFMDKIIILSEKKADIKEQIEENAQMLKNWKSIMSIITLQYDGVNNNIHDDITTNQSSSHQNSSHTYQVLKSYHLPILYGLLGAIVYILRTLSFSLKNLSFKRRDLINLRLHLVLGSFAGLLIGLFVVSDNSETSPSLSNLSLVGLAFIAGYSSEFLFAFIERQILQKKSENKG